MLSAYTAWQQAMSQSSSSIPVATTSINDFTSAIDNSGAAAKQAADAMASAQQGIADWLAKTMLGQLSPLTPVDKLGFSHDRYVENLVAAQGRDLGALQGYTGIADEYLQQLASYYGVGSAEYMKGFAGVTGQAADLAGLSDARSVTAGDLKAGFKSVVDEVAKLRAEVGLLHDDQLHFRMMFERSSRTTAQQLTEAIRDGALGFG